MNIVAWHTYMSSAFSAGVLSHGQEFQEPEARWVTEDAEEPGQLLHICPLREQRMS